MLSQRYDRSMELDAGQVIGSWEVQRVLGRGAMAVVYQVHHRTLGTYAALKVLDRVDPATEQRLLQEGRAQGSIDHPGIVAVLDHLRAGDHAALLLEWVDGSDLSKLLQSGPLPLRDALDLFRQIAHAIAAAHTAGLVHRDLKPSNVLVSENSDGRRTAKVGDFGLVKIGTVDLTATNAMLGTPRYMAPEQMRAARLVDARADIFSLGAMLYEMCCGRPAFDGDDLVALYTAKMGSHYAAPDRLMPELPPEIKAAISGCLKGSPSLRIPSCQVLLSVLNGEPWSPPSDETSDAQTPFVLCPSCGAPVADEHCAACMASSTLAARYRLIELRSERRETRVWRAIDLRDGSFVTVRALARAAADLVRERFRRGVSVSQQLHHNQIARWIDGPFEEHGHTFEVREWIDGSSLADISRVHRQSERDVLEMVLELCPPLGYLAQRSPPVLHRALGPDNVIRKSDGRLVLIDFSQVRDTPGDGSLHDVPEGAPEQWVGEATEATDIYGLGSLAVTLLARKPVHTLRRAGGLSLEELVGISEETRALLRNMLQDDPLARPSIDLVAQRARALIDRAGAQPIPVRKPPTPGANATLALILGAALAAALITMLLLGSAFVLFVQQSVIPRAKAREAAEVNKEIEAPEGPSPLRLLEPGLDLADKQVPGTSCGPDFEQTITLSGTVMPDDSSPSLYARGCDGQYTSLGPLALGESHQIVLHGSSTLYSPFHQLKCGGSDCFLSEAAVASTMVDIRPETSQKVSFKDDAPAEVRWLPAREDHWQIQGGLPQLSRPLEISRDIFFSGAVPLIIAADQTVPMAALAGTSKLIDGVYRRSLWVVPKLELVVLPVIAEYRIQVKAIDGSPIADAEVLCSGGLSKSRSSGRTDATGTITCDAGKGDRPWAVVQSPGHVAEMTELIPPVVQVTLRDARTWRVGCAGLPGGICSTMGTPPSCAGGNGRSSGICRFSGDALLCECSPDADRLVHGVLGTVTLPSEGVQVWYDLRELKSRVEGFIEDANRNCSISLTTRNGSLYTKPVQGRFAISSVPEGRYLIEGCGVSKQLIDVGEGPNSLTLTSTLKALNLIQPKQMEEAIEEATEERQLLNYTFPTWPTEIPPTKEHFQCIMSVDISPEGRATRVVPKRCPPGFELPARKAVETWSWVPGEAATTEELIVPFKQRL